MARIADIEAMFSNDDEGYSFARWGRPIAPLVFGVDESTLRVVKGAIDAVVQLAGHQMSETDPELGANFIVLFLRSWVELALVPRTDEMMPDLVSLADRLMAEDATQYRSFRFDDNRAIKSCTIFLNMGSQLADLAAEDIALTQAAQAILLWGPDAFAERSPLAKAGETVILRPDIADIIRAAYDPVMPLAADDPSHALRLAARVGG
ncbi:MAG: hypothetical protein GKR99_14505 [Rhodobacteraceae bacterium]|nr:hypothetical protein [Paracoccaceae bacterium]